MKNNKNISTPLAPVLTARMLSGALGEPESTWVIRLANGRRANRSSPIPWETTEAGHPVYRSDDVEAFIERTLAHRALGASRAEYGRGAKATAVADAEGERPFVRVFWNTGMAQGAFGLDIDTAVELSKKLVEASKLAKARKDGTQ